MINKILNDPYRLLFPLGLIYLLIGVSIWFPIAFFHSEYYPVILHHFLLIDGFMLSFIGGFLMTAVPKFSKSYPTKPLELIIFAILPFLGLKDALNESNNILLISMLQSLFLLQFMLMRIFKRKENPPYTFIFIPMALLMIAVVSLLGFFDSPYYSIEALFLCPISLIILGIGSRLIPGILGHVEIVKQQREIYEKPLPLFSTIPKNILILSLLFISTFFYQHWISNLIQFQIVAYFAFKYWNLGIAPKTKTALTWSIWITCWFFVSGYLLKLLWPSGAIHGLHWIFIAVFANLAILISTRVTVSHAGQESSLENSKILFWITFFSIFAMSTRILAYILTDLYESHLGYGAFLMIVMAFLWIFKYARYFFV